MQIDSTQTRHIYVGYSHNLPVRTSNKEKLNFGGHLGAEKYIDKSVQFLTKETGFFRDPETDKFLVDYIFKNLAHKDKIRIFMGGCSTGEEVVTMSMLLNKISNKVELTGFDLSAKSIKLAKKGIFYMQNVSKKSLRDKERILSTSLKDYYLAFPHDGELSNEQILQKSLFNEYFTEISSVSKKINNSMLERIKDYISRKIFCNFYMSLDTKKFKLNEGKAKNCRFVQGDILDIEKIVGKEKADIITFRNAIYHLLCEDMLMGWRSTKPNAINIAVDVCKKMESSLNKKGLIVFGKDEASQILDGSIMPRVMTDLGFEPLNRISNDDVTIWRKKD